MSVQEYQLGSKKLLGEKFGNGIFQYVKISQQGAENLSISRFLDTVGDGSGDKNAVGDYSINETSFFIKPPSDIIFRITNFSVMIQGNNIAWQKYGNKNELTNGVIMRLKNDENTFLDLSNVKIKTNSLWSINCTFAEIKIGKTGDDLFQGDWFFKRNGQNLRLRGDRGDRFEIVLNDDFTGLNRHMFKVDGLIEGIDI